MEGRGKEGKGGPCPQKLSIPQLKFLVAPLSKLRHKVHQKVRKCSLTFPLQDGIVTFYEHCTNNILQSII